jgi:hypothetical protein
MITVNRVPYLAFSFLLLSLTSCENDEPEASFTVEQDPENKPQYATFTSTSRNAEVVRWNIEGATFTAPVVEYRFTTAGTHRVQLEITNEDGETDLFSQDVEIPFVDPCGAAWRAKDQSLYNQYFAEHNIIPLQSDKLGFKFQYVVTKPGNGRKIITGHESVTFKTYYYLLDGTLVLTHDEYFYKELNEFGEDAVSQLMTMEEGSTARWFLPSCNGYSGANGYYNIPPYSPLIKEIVLVTVGPEPCQC